MWNQSKMEEFKEWKFIFTILIPLTNGIIIIYNRQSFRLILQYVKKKEDVFIIVHFSIGVYEASLGWPYFDYQKPGHSAQQTDGPTQMIAYSKFTQRNLINFNTFKVGYASSVWIEKCYIVIWKQDLSWENRTVGHRQVYINK